MVQVTYPKCKVLKSAKANDKIVMKITLKKLICGYGETGKHVWFRSICRETCRFKSCYPHHRSKPYVSRLWAFFVVKGKTITTKKQVHNLMLCTCQFLLFFYFNSVMIINLVPYLRFETYHSFFVVVLNIL